ncbi:hypothetical protein [Sphingomonas sp.]|uniref:hypothetical protein n=1 Tax=Sphingomonas sp. TaxID=28214 RepID=UPI003AFFD462
MSGEADERHEETPLPWETEPSGLGTAHCEWCGRDINAPALPCSATDGEGIASAATTPGLGERCKWELRVRGFGT